MCTKKIKERGDELIVKGSEDIPKPTAFSCLGIENQCYYTSKEVKDKMEDFIKMNNIKN